MSRSGNVAGDQYERAANNWYCEGPPPVRQLMNRLSFVGPNGPDMIWDACCGRGNILDVAKERGHQTVGSDIIDRHARHKFFRGNFLKATRSPNPGDRRLSLICNPPYGDDNSGTGGGDDIAQAFMRHAVQFPIYRAAFLVPIGFQASVGRYRFFTRDCRPSHIAICCERPSMPPGHMIEEMGAKAFKGGRLDYCWVVFTYPHDQRCETIFLKPDSIP